MSRTRRSHTRKVVGSPAIAGTDEDGALRLLTRLCDRATGPAAATDLEPIRDADDLHEIDLDAELWHRLPEAPAAGPDHA